MQISKPLLYALVSTVADDLQIGDEFHINTWHEEVDTRNHFDYRNTVNIPPTLPTQQHGKHPPDPSYSTLPILSRRRSGRSGRVCIYRYHFRLGCRFDQVE